MDLITRSEMEHTAAADLAWLRQHDPNGYAAWAAVQEDSTPETPVESWDQGAGNTIYVMPEHAFALATYGQTEPLVVSWEAPGDGLSIIEDSGGGIWLYGRTWDGTAIYYGDMAYSGAGAVEELTMAYHDGIGGWEHGQDNDQPICYPPQGQTIAEYDGETLTLYVQRMGAAGRRYCLGVAATVR